MYVDKIELFHVALPLRRPLATPRGPHDRLETVLAAVHGGGAVGWGEASPGCAPTHYAEWTAGAFALLRDWLAPAVVGKTMGSGKELAEQFKPFLGNPFARAALDTAWWDLEARLKNCPLHELLSKAGLSDNKEIEVGPTFDRMETIGELIAEIAAATAAGFRRVKLKFRPGWDVRMVDCVRKEFPTLDLIVDCEGGLGLHQTDMLYRLQDFAPAMIEQPLGADDLVGHAMLQDALRTPICLDESIDSIAQAEMALELKSCRAINLKPGRVGGHTPALAITALCRDAGAACYVGAIPQSTIASRHGFALAAAAGNGNGRPLCAACAHDFFPSDIIKEDLAETLLPRRDDTEGRQGVPFWTTPGIGVEPDRARLEKYCVNYFEVQSHV